MFFMIIEPVHEISNDVVCATSKASDQPAHTRSLIRGFASRLSILWLLSYWLNTIWSSKLKSRLHRLFRVYTCQNATLLEISCTGSLYNLIHGVLYTTSRLSIIIHLSLIFFTCSFLFSKVKTSDRYDEPLVRGYHFYSRWHQRPQFTDFSYLYVLMKYAHKMTVAIRTIEIWFFYCTS